MARFFRRFYRTYRSYRRKYSRSRKWLAKPLKATKTMTITCRQTGSIDLQFAANADVSNVRMFTAYPADNANLKACDANVFTKFVQLFGEFKINSLRMELVPTTGIINPITIYTVADRKVTKTESVPTIATVTQSMTAVSKTYTSASITRIRRVLKAAGINEKSTYIDATSSAIPVNGGIGFLPGFYVGAFSTVTNTAPWSVVMAVTVMASVTFRNPLY